MLRPYKGRCNTGRKAIGLYARLCNHELTDACDWLVLHWLTWSGGERESVPPLPPWEYGQFFCSFELLGMDGCGIMAIRTRDLGMIGRKLFCCAPREHLLCSFLHTHACNTTEEITPHRRNLMHDGSTKNTKSFSQKCKSRTVCAKSGMKIAKGGTNSCLGREMYSIQHPQRLFPRKDS